MKQEGIKDVAVIDRQDAAGYNYLCAYLVVEEGVKIEEINRAMEEEVSEYRGAECVCGDGGVAEDDKREGGQEEAAEAWREARGDGRV